MERIKADPFDEPITLSAANAGCGTPARELLFELPGQESAFAVSKLDALRSLFTVGLALLLIRAAEYRTGQTWRSLRSQLERMHVGEFAGPDERVLQRTESTPEQGRMFQALKTSEPPRLFAVTPTPQSDA